MSTFEPDAPDILGGTDEESRRPRGRRPLWQRIVFFVVVVVGVIAVVGALLYWFGGMSGSAYDPEIKGAYQQLVDTRQAAPVERRFVIPIPGCTCHSTDPYLTEQHRNRRLSECMGCHGG